MSDLTYHLRGKRQNYFNRRPGQWVKKLLTKDILLSLAVTTSEKSGLNFSSKSKRASKARASHRFPSMLIALSSSLNGSEQRVSRTQEKKVVIDPFTLLDIYFEVNSQDPMKLSNKVVGDGESSQGLSMNVNGSSLHLLLGFSRGSFVPSRRDFESLG